MEKYTNIEAVQAYLGSDITSEENTRVKIYIDQMSRYIDKETNYFPLVAGTQDETRKYDGNGGCEVFIDDIAKEKVTEVKINDSVVTEYEIPSNYSDGGYMLFVDAGISKGTRNVEITGKFGKFLSVPSDIEFACTVLVAGIVFSSRNELQEVNSETIGRYTVSYGSSRQKADIQMAKEIIKTYRKVSII